MKPSDFKVGQRVRYQTPFMIEPELGTVTSINERYVFVKYDKGNKWGIATSPDHLKGVEKEWIANSN